MNKIIFIVPVMMAILPGCGMVNKMNCMVNESTQAIQCNRRAVEMSTRAIRQNIQAVEDSNQAIAENRRQLDAINDSMKDMNQE